MVSVYASHRAAAHFLQHQMVFLKVVTLPELICTLTNRMVGVFCFFCTNATAVIQKVVAPFLVFIYALQLVCVGSAVVI